MITVTRLNGTKVMINALLIELVEETPDTIISLTTGKKIIVAESASDLLLLVQSYLRTIGVYAATQKSEQTEGP
ncbi:flagellar FlbD family protein [Paenibacillus radicis (ex Gao et al. 2016)]|uniref:Flagellar protein FlbD n=1 Tax=Paenibacillus radicis (ex Gao et al. 2016) TaxID=1737354 RepID=A0A917HIH2_9BACL|nr:flagellar FlbD family protein [Paenibacillus radicis (ex Gao et al. 2016)]GGG80741.1 flagellar protein FlbD [Paenibacillus radicis (ex Gao et al. 2016)]